MDTVVLKACKAYDVKRIQKELIDALDLLGGLDQYIESGERVLLKVNLLMKKRPEEATTTHPAFVEALAELLIEHGCEVIIGDSPGGPFTQGALKGIYKACGYEELAGRLPVSLNYNVNAVDVQSGACKILKKLSVIEVMTQVDKVISVSKLKTHGMMRFTGAVKNLFGTIPGLTKAEYHFKMPGIEEFSDMLVDVCMNANPVLSFMDGIVGMEGAGPSAGEPRFLGVILVSPSPYALDLAAVDIVGMEAASVPTVMRSIERKLVPDSLDKVNLVGASMDQFRIDDFEIPRIGNPEFLRNAPTPIKKLADLMLKPRPVFRYSKCVGCGECARSCPPTAIIMNQKRPEVNLEKCIRCYCCQELCPAKAVDIHKPLMNKLFFKY
jgi:uncharacterized protein (DUF362 family)/Pyruvate/2-oxoacid:ferredoxin oxidoreductase delta subunit